MREKVLFSHITAAGSSHTFNDTSFLLGESLSNVYRSMTAMHVRRRSAKAFLNHGRIVQHVQPALLVHVCKCHNHKTSPSSAESLPRLLPLLIPPPPTNHSSFCCLHYYCSTNVMNLVLNRLDGHKYGSGSNIKQHQQQLCQVLAKCNQIQTCLGPSMTFMLLISLFFTTSSTNLSHKSTQCLQNPPS